METQGPGWPQEGVRGDEGREDQRAGVAGAGGGGQRAHAHSLAVKETFKG